MADLFKWSESYSVGIEQIDQQHKTWLSLINDLHSAQKDGSGKEASKRILAGVVDYTHTHFAYEEKELVRCGYPDYDRHKQLHDLFASQMSQLQKEADTNPLAISIKVMEQLRVWLVNHITNQDTLYAPYLKQKKAA